MHFDKQWKEDTAFIETRINDMIACKFFNDHRKVCWWANEKKSHIDIISVTFVPRGGWCVFYKENSKNKEDIELAIKTTNG